ncbi:ANTAR domain-containing protein [Streptomyces sp. NPDC048436]|uniref:ANTAR domain-containing protein n=1 Tax=Streptomyces sp. NPDC048436 TaxID=3365550 RepID=UPI0037106E43
MPEPANSEEPLPGEDTEHARGVPPSLPGLSAPAVLDTVPDGDRVSAIMRGELDLEACQRLRPELLDALNCSADGVDLYLSEVTFCDCSGIGLLLSLRRLASRHGKTVTVLSRSTAVERMFDLSATHDLFEPDEPLVDPCEPPRPGHPGHPGHPGDENGTRPDGGDTGADAESDESLRIVVSQLRRAMQTRPTIDLARGILMSVFSLSPEASWDVLVMASQNTNTKLHHLAEDLVGTVHGPELPEAVQKQLVAAVAKANKAPAAPSSGAGAATTERPGDRPRPDPHRAPEFTPEEPLQVPPQATPHVPAQASPQVEGGKRPGPGTCPATATPPLPPPGEP